MGGFATEIVYFPTKLELSRQKSGAILIVPNEKPVSRQVLCGFDANGD
jgi:hypothetical protein